MECLVAETAINPTGWFGLQVVEAAEGDEVTKKHEEEDDISSSPPPWTNMKPELVLGQFCLLRKTQTKSFLFLEMKAGESSAQHLLMI